MFFSEELFQIGPKWTSSSKEDLEDRFSYNEYIYQISRHERNCGKGGRGALRNLLGPSHEMLGILLSNGNTHVEENKTEKKKTQDDQEEKENREEENGRRRSRQSGERG